MSFSAAIRRLHLDNDLAPVGYSIDYLSPWSDMWEGSGFTANLKHIFPKQFTLEVSGAYFDKQFVDVEEISGDGTELIWQGERIDQMFTATTVVSKAVNLGDRQLIIPSVTLAYRHNESTIRYLGYEGLQIEIALRAGL